MRLKEIFKSKLEGMLNNLSEYKNEIYFFNSVWLMFKYDNNFFLTEEEVKRYIDKVILRRIKLERLRLV